MKTVIPIGIGILIGAGVLWWQYTAQTTPNDLFANLDQNAPTAAMVASLEEMLRNNPATYDTYIDLSYAYLQYVRETGDYRAYSRITEIIQTAHTAFGSEPELTALRAQVALGQHHFTEAKQLLNELTDIHPDTARYYGLLGDAEIELGNYTEATRAYQKMVNTRPDYAAFTRIAHLRELHGDFTGAQEALSQAFIASAPYAENIAWVRVELAKLYSATEPASAQAQLDAALEIVPDYLPALIASAELAYQEGDEETALSSALAAYATRADASTATLLGDLYISTGDTSKAEQYYTLAETAFVISEANGQNIDGEYARFLSERNRNNDLALDRAEAAVNTAPNSANLTSLALAYHNAGQLAEAAANITQALDTDAGSYSPYTLLAAAKIYTALRETELAQTMQAQLQTLPTHQPILQTTYEASL